MKMSELNILFITVPSQYENVNKVYKTSKMNDQGIRRMDADSFQ